MKDVTPLADGWTLHPLPSGGPPPRDVRDQLADGVPAAVPGCVHTDLMAAGLLADPFLDRNEADAAWVGRADWEYHTVLAPPGTGHERTDLVFEGLDTVAEVVLGGRVLGAARNMHRTHRFDATGLLGPGPTALAVRFTSAYTEAEAQRDRLGDRPNAYPEPFPFLRKMACSFGWDWGPTLVTAGIWRPARLEHWSTARLARVRPLVAVGDGTGRVTVHADLARTDRGAGRELLLRARVGRFRAEVAVPAGADGAAVTVTVPDPELWWPRGHGGQPRYGCVVTLADRATGEELDRWSRRIGFRTVELDTGPDEHGSGFTFVVNGERLFARGVNWIPDDVFPSRIGADRYRARLAQAARAGVNLVRVWGGGVYESEDFYDACDELGLMVWQDFLFACAAYPEEEPLRSEVEAEARDNVARLAPHPSLVLWCGNNENLWGFTDWGWRDALAGASWGEGYYLDLLPRVVAEVDPTRPYWPGSPWSGSWERHPNDPAHGNAHSWEVWNRDDYTRYRDSVPRFVAEFGWQAPPAWATLRRALRDDPPAPDSPGMLHHQKAEDGNGKLARGLARHFADPASFDDWHYLTQVNQARAVAAGVEHWRAHWPVCAGTVVWQLNDCWPVTSWSAIDGDGRPKPLYHELRRLYADRLLTVQVPDGRPRAVAVNDSAAPWSGTVLARRVAVDGTVAAEARVPFSAGPRSVVRVALPEHVVPAPGCAKELLVVDAGELRALWSACPDREFAHPRPAYDVEVARRGAGAEVTVRARALLRDLLLQADRLHPDAVADRGLVTLLPGESVTIAVANWPEPSREAAEAALYCVNAAQPAPGGDARDG
ncbi:glycoside hydrolase family 2 protein [Streptomyces capparidis]